LLPSPIAPPVRLIPFFFVRKGDVEIEGMQGIKEKRFLTGLTGFTRSGKLCLIDFS